MLRAQQAITKRIGAIVLACASCMACTAEWAASAAPPQHATPVLRGGLDNPDFLVWLGPVPDGLTREQVRERSTAVFDVVMKDIAAGHDLKSFACKTPAEVGPVPMMDSVERYIDGLPDSRDDDALLHGLNQAARAGNWIARANLFFLMSQRRQSDLVVEFRMIQLMEWMHERRLGALYAFVGDTIMASGITNGLSGNEPTAMDEFAALRHSYQAQYEVGQHLKKSDDPDEVRLGERMIACALGSSPTYARVFTGEAEKARDARYEREHEASFSPLHRAVRDGDAAQVDKLLAAPGTDVNARSSGDQTPLDMAFLGKVQDARIVKALIQRGADVAGNGAVDKRGGRYDQDEVLNRAVKAKPADLQVVEMLVKAGAEPFKRTAVHETIVTTPFSDSFDAYEAGSQPELLEFLLSTKKLDPRSELAGEYLERSVRHPKVLARLLAYGIKPEQVDDLLSEIAQAGSYPATLAVRHQYLAIAGGLVQRYPSVAQSILGEQGYRSMKQAASICNLEFASWLLDKGAAMHRAGHDDPGAMVSTVVDHCDKDRSLEPDTDSLANRDHWRKVFLEKLKAKGYDFNVDAKRCPAWSYDGSSCNGPEDDSLASLLLALGADPYRWYPRQERSALISVIDRCRGEVLDLMLAKPPRKLDALTREGLDAALEATTREPWSGLNCPADFMGKTARRLISYGARKGASR